MRGWIRVRPRRTGCSVVRREVWHALKGLGCKEPPHKLYRRVLWCVADAPYETYQNFLGKIPLNRSNQPVSFFSGFSRRVLAATRGLGFVASDDFAVGGAGTFSTKNRGQ